MWLVHQASVRVHCASHYAPAHLASWFHDRGPDIYRPAIDAGHVWLAESAGHLLGFAAAAPGEVTLLFVNPVHAGRGVGQRLLAQAMTAASVGHDGPLAVTATLNSVAFYQRHGFVTVGDDAFVRGQDQLHYPLKRMLRASSANRR